MNTLRQIAEFYKKNRLLILSALTIMVVVHWCSRRGENIREKVVTPSEQVTGTLTDKLAPTPEAPLTNWLPYLLMVGVVLLVFVAKRRGWIEKLIPGMVLVRTSIFRSKENKRRMMRLFIMNTTRSGQTFSNPVVEFIRPGGKKAFVIHVTGVAAFPITLTTNTSHMLVIDLDRFYDKVPELKKYRWVKVKMTVNGTREKTSMLRWVR